MTLTRITDFSCESCRGAHPGWRPTPFTAFPTGKNTASIPVRRTSLFNLTLGITAVAGGGVTVVAFFGRLDISVAAKDNRHTEPAILATTPFGTSQFPIADFPAL